MLSMVKVEGWVTDKAVVPRSRRGGGVVVHRSPTCIHLSARGGDPIRVTVEDGMWRPPKNTWSSKKGAPYERPARKARWCRYCGGTPTEGPGRWADAAACNGLPVDWWVPAYGTSPAAIAKGYAQAREVCGDCPVRWPCLDWALQQGEQYGLWGGYSAKDRRLLQQGKLSDPQFDEWQRLVWKGRKGNRG